MTLEELQAKVEALESEKESINAKNKELLTELKTARNKNKEVDTDAYYKALDEVDNLKAENSKLNQTLGLKTKEVEKLSTTLNELDTNLKTTKLENTLNDELSKLRVKPTVLSFIKDGLQAKSKFSEDGSILIGDKSISDYLAEWANTDSGKDCIMPSGNSGSGASGGNGSSNLTGKLDGTKSEQEAYIKAKFNL